MTTKPKKTQQLPKQSESSIQAAFFDWLSLHEKKYPELGLFYAIPNGANKSPAARGLFKRTGLKAGVPDVHLPKKGQKIQDGLYHGPFYGLFIEFKVPGKYPSPEQREWIDKLKDAQNRVEVCRSWTEAADITIDYLNLPIKKFDA